MKLFTPSIATLATALLTLTSNITHASFEQDRKAILSMAGKYNVTFRFHETQSLTPDYQITKKKYEESAHELVKVIEDTGKKITLQHLLIVDNGVDTTVVKHWAQEWRYEDNQILEYQQDRTWIKKAIPIEKTKDTWTQYVTQVDGSPRYEGIGKWTHVAETSEWMSNQTPRPLPRREYSKRSDYDVLLAYNHHIITPTGWVHSQTNSKLVKRDAKQKVLCLESGFNTYQKAPDYDFTPAEKYWEDHVKHWLPIHTFWNNLVENNNTISYTTESNGQSMRKALRALMPTENTPAPTQEQVNTTLKPFTKTTL